ncbi:MAG: hypothetical protein U0105_24850 [Candidatus Obscuribacterales bacterium]
MSVVFSLAIPIDQLPPPVDFINKLAPKWLEAYPSELVAPNTMGNTILPICPDLENYGENSWAYDQSYTFYLSNASTRGLEVWYRDGEFMVRVLTLSTVPEWEFAFQILELAAGGENALVTTDWEPETLRIADLRKEFDGRIGDAIRSQLVTLWNLIEEQNQMVCLAGPINEFWMGPRFCSRVLADPQYPNEKTDDVLETVFAVMLIVNYLGVMPRFADVQPVEMEVTETADGKWHHNAQIEEGQKYFVPVVDSLTIFESREGRTTIRSEDFAELLGGFFREQEEIYWLDEYQFLIGPIDDERLGDFAQYILAHRRKSGQMGIIKGKPAQ